uniref:Uncharacterized protein n=1 Tax=Heterorhabditis bacteriophora TaxID=37862 RepID=A0A1I7X1D8_HETBA
MCYHFERYYNEFCRSADDKRDNNQHSHWEKSNHSRFFYLLTSFSNHGGARKLNGNKPKT